MPTGVYERTGTIPPSRKGLVSWNKGKKNIYLRDNVDNGATVCENCDYKLVNHNEKEWEPIFNMILGSRI